MKKAAAQSRKREEEEEERAGQESKGFLNTIGNLFLRSRAKPIEETRAAVLSPEDQETLRTYEYQLEMLLSEDCMLCGNLFIEGVDLPFDSAEEFSWAT